ncbi:MAG TPA: TetR/AcrR family transcriptional regulator [Novosphingobium sp.]|jgi:AcrR family transcriptional regulator|nr:TetR/AcrR family transcriptional regulator [Novosphingobium sp.]
MEAAPTNSGNTVALRDEAATKPHRPLRGRPTAQQVASIDRAIVQAARDMFLADGFDAVGMKQVAERARVSKGTLYSRYPSKEVLFTAVIEQTVEDWSAEAAQGDALLTDDIAQRLRHHARTIASWLGRPDVLALQRLLVSMRERFPAPAETMRRRGYDYIVGLIARDIRQAAARDGTTLRDPLAVARMLVAAITGAHMQEDADGTGEEALQAFAQRVVDVIIGGQGNW